MTVSSMRWRPIVGNLFGSFDLTCLHYAVNISIYERLSLHLT
jgi:hypothetical protein